MKKLIFLFIMSFMLFSCGSIKNSVEQEVFTDSEKALFNVAVEKYKVEEHNTLDKDISSSVTDVLLTINVVWKFNTANSIYNYQYKFTKEEGKFIVREYKNDEFFTEISNEDFTILLEEVLYIEL